MCGVAKVHSPAFSIGREYPRIVLYGHSLSIFICLFFLFYIQIFIIMLCYLQSAELRPRDGKLPFFICKWQGVIGDTSADKVTDEGNGILEIKNIATVPPFQRKGYAKALIEFLVEKYRRQFSILQVGTGDSPLTIPFYEKCGFVRSHTVPNFFTDHYDHPIYECGVHLVDMVYMQRPL